VIILDLIDIYKSSGKNHTLPLKGQSKQDKCEESIEPNITTDQNSLFRIQLVYLKACKPNES
jgi:hypothetical protein